MSNVGGEQPSMATKVASEGSAVAETAREQTGEIASTARARAGDVAGTAVDEGKRMVNEARDSLHEQARTRTSELGRSVRRLGDGMMALAEGRPQDAGAAADYARQAAQRTRELAQRLETDGYDGIADEMADFARRRPGVFLLGAGVLGFTVGRMLRSGAFTADNDGASGNADPAGALARVPVGAMPSSEAPLAMRADEDPTLSATGMLPSPGGRP